MKIFNSLSSQHKVILLLNNQRYVLDPNTHFNINSQTPDLLGTIDVDNNYIGTVAQTTQGSYKIVQGVGSPGIFIQNLN